MKKVRFVFYRARFDLINVMRGKRKAHLIDDGISLWTGLFNWWTPPYSHMSVWIPRENGGQFMGLMDLVDHVDDAFFGTCYTSTMRGKDNGTVKRPASEVFKHPERWEYIEFEVTGESFEEAKASADEKVKNNKGYSKPDIRRFFLPLWLFKKLKWDDPEREICSEHGEGWAVRLKSGGRWVWHFRTAIGLGVLDKILIRSPRRLWRDLVKRHQVPTYSLATGKMVRDGRGKRVKV